MKRASSLPLLKFIDRNTCATLSHNTAYDRCGPKPSPLSLCHVDFKTRHFSAPSKPSAFLPAFFLLCTLSPSVPPSHGSSYISTGSSVTWFSDRVVISLIYTREKHFQCSCHVVGAFLYMFYTFLNLCKEGAADCLSSIHTFIQVNAGFPHGSTGPQSLHGSTG